MFSPSERDLFLEEYKSIKEKEIEGVFSMFPGPSFETQRTRVEFQTFIYNLLSPNKTKGICKPNNQTFDALQDSFLLLNSLRFFRRRRISFFCLSFEIFLTGNMQG